MATTRKDRARIEDGTRPEEGKRPARALGASERERRGCQGFGGWRRTVKEEAPMKERCGERER